MAIHTRTPSKKVAIVYRYIPQYRKDTFELLIKRLACEGIELIILYGQPNSKEVKKHDAVTIPGAIYKKTIIIPIGDKEICWQPILSSLEGFDLVIVEQASRFLVNYVLVFGNMLGMIKMAYWGHGRNLQAKNPNSFAEWIKRKVSTRVSWWFAYNDFSAKIVTDLGFPSERITVVQNAIDTSNLRAMRERLTLDDIEKKRAELGITGEHIGIYVGGMYAEKRIQFLLQSLVIIREKIPDFEMIFIGSGVDAGLVNDMAHDYSWVHDVGPKFDEEKVPYFALAQLFLMPGLVGLSILDCFALGVPLVTTSIREHSSEIDYLNSGSNGIMVDVNGGPDAYAQAVIGLFQDEAKRRRLVDGCLESSQQYTIEEMVERFARGIKLALAQ
jgi:glycosyltransferase involved in cell wall biosynthesis